MSGTAPTSGYHADDHITNRHISYHYMIFNKTFAHVAKYNMICTQYITFEMSENITHNSSISSGK